MSSEFLNSKIFGIKWSRLLLNCSQTLYMVGWGLLFGTLIGLVLALTLVLMLGMLAYTCGVLPEWRSATLDELTRVFDWKNVKTQDMRLPAELTRRE